MNPLIQVTHLTYRHPGTAETVPPALKEVNFSIDEGDFVALVGANGSGKTTLARHLNALITPTSGDVLVNGLNTRERANHMRIRSQVGMVFQHPEDQIVASIVEEDVAFGPENLCHLPEVIRQEVDQALAIVGMSQNRRREPHLLSAGQMQRVALAGALAMQPRCIIFDEATAMLDPRGRREVLARMAELNHLGITVIFITHFMEEVLHANRVLALNRGVLVFDGSPHLFFSDVTQISACGLERPLAARFQAAFQFLFPGYTSAANSLDQLLSTIPQYTGEAGLLPGSIPVMNQSSDNEVEIRDLSHTYMANTPLAHQGLVSVSMDVKKGVPHGLVGATGSGKSTLLQHLNGLYRPQTGSMRVGPFDLNSSDLDVKALRRYAGLVFQNPELYFFKQYAGDEIAYAPKLVNGVEGLRQRVMWAMELVDLDFETFKDRIVSTLSGGEQRKVALAAALAARPSLLILDEPTAGLDPRSRRSLLSNLRQLDSEGMDIIFSSHNMDDMAEMVQNLTVLSNGSSLVTQPAAQVFTNARLMVDAGLEEPGTIRLAQALRAHGWPVPLEAVSLESIASSIGLVVSRDGAENHE